MSTVAFVSSNLATVFLDSFLYGIFFVLSASSMYLLVQRERRHNSRVTLSHIIRNPMLASSICMICCVTAHWIIIVFRAFMAFIYFEGGTLPIAYYGNLSDVTEVVKTAFSVASFAIFDAVMIYRLYIIWDGNVYAILFSAGCLIGEIICSVGAVYQFTRYKPNQDVFSSALGRWIATAAIFTLAVNLSSSCLIAWRLWRAHQRIRAQNSNLMWVLAILVESAAIYVAWTIAFIAIYEVQTNVQFTFIDTWAVVAGIAFMLINVRVGAGWGKHNEYSVRSRASAHHESSGTGTQGQDARRAAVRMAPLAVRVSTEVDEDADGEGYAVDAKPRSLGGASVRCAAGVV